jgi:dTDP-4-dehydrorhamnose 3,5-epimerase-like enzyme
MKYIIKNAQFNEDDRAQRIFLQFNEMRGQINLSHVNSTGHVVAWHKHEKQIDYWFCVRGSFKVGLALPQGDGSYKVEWEYLSDKLPRVIRIPPGVYHGYKALQPESIMLYHLTEKYDVNDEWKVNPGHFGENWETENK